MQSGSRGKYKAKILFFAFLWLVPTAEAQSKYTLDQVFAKMDEVQKTTLFGTAVHAVLKPGRLDVTALRDRLEAQGFEITAVDRVMASLEDVFLDVVERAS